MADHAFTSVLVPLDGSELSEQAVPFALALAGDGGRVTLMQALPDAEPLRKPFGAITMTEEEVGQMLDNLAQDDGIERRIPHFRKITAQEGETCLHGGNLFRTFAICIDDRGLRYIDA